MTARAGRRPIVQRLFFLFVLTVPAFIERCGRDINATNYAVQMVKGSIPSMLNPASWSAVALVEKSTGEHFCSGTLIAANLVVTAAHCVFDRRPEDFQVMFGRDTKDGQSVFRSAVARETYKKIQKYESNFDIAWVKFEGDLPAGFRPIEIWHQPSSLVPSTALTIAGYGRTASQCDQSDPTCHGGKLLTVETMIREFVNKGRLFNLIVISPRQKSGPCFGDSGGPAYLQKNGAWYLAGDFMGWDRLLVAEEVDTICDTGEAIYNFVGDFVAWIEESAQVKLAFDPAINPRQDPPQLDFISEEPLSFTAWCEYNNHEDPAWFTVQRLIRMASDFRIQSGEPDAARQLFEDCAVAEEWLRRMIKAEPRLAIAGFDPAHFIDSARLEDIRPLRSLRDMGIEELSLSDHSIADLSPIEALQNLAKLEIIDNVLPNQLRNETSPSLQLASFPALKTLHLQNPGAKINFQGLAQLKSIESLDLSYLQVNTLAGIDALSITNLHLDNINCPEAIDLARLTRLQSLYLAKIKVARLPVVMNQLESLELLTVSGLSALPSEAFKLQKLFLYESDLSGVLELGQWPEINEVTVVKNIQLQDVRGLSGRAKLQFVEISENSLVSLAPITDLPALVTLTLNKNQLKNLPDLVALPVLEKLDLEGNQLSSVAGLTILPKLEYINLNRNPLLSLEGLAGFPALKRLSIQETKGQGLSNLKGMRELPVLEELNLNRNSLTKIDSLLAFSNLRVLILSDNKLEDISSLKKLKKLDYLELVGNPLKQKICPLAKANACRFEWLGVSVNGPIVVPKG